MKKTPLLIIIILVSLTLLASCVQKEQNDNPTIDNMTNEATESELETNEKATQTPTEEKSEYVNEGDGEWDTEDMIADNGGSAENSTEAVTNNAVTGSNETEVPTEEPTASPENSTEESTASPETSTEESTASPETPTERPAASPENPTEEPTESRENPTEEPTASPEPPAEEPEIPNDPDVETNHDENQGEWDII